jgi:hypothetical protein
LSKLWLRSIFFQRQSTLSAIDSSVSLLDTMQQQDDCCPRCAANTEIAMNRLSVINTVERGQRIAHLLADPSLRQAMLDIMLARKFNPYHRSHHSLESVRDLFVWARTDQRLTWIRVYLADQLAINEAELLDVLVGLLAAWSSGLHARLVIAVSRRSSHAFTFWFELLADYWMPVYRDEYNQPCLCTARVGVDEVYAFLVIHRNRSLMDVTHEYVENLRERRMIERVRERDGLSGCCPWFARTIERWGVACCADSSVRDTAAAWCQVCLSYRLYRRPSPPNRACYVSRRHPAGHFVHKDQLWNGNDDSVNSLQTVYPPTARPVRRVNSRASDFDRSPDNCFYSRMSVYRLRTEHEWLLRGMRLNGLTVEPVASWPDHITDVRAALDRYHRALLTRVSVEYGIEVNVLKRLVAASTNTTTATVSTAAAMVAGGSSRLSQKRKAQTPLYGGWQCRRIDPPAYLSDTPLPSVIALFHELMLPSGTVHVTDLPRPLHALHLAKRHGVPAARALIVLYPRAVYHGLVVPQARETFLRSVYFCARTMALRRWFGAIKRIRVVLRIGRRESSGCASRKNRHTTSTAAVYPISLFTTSTASA